MPPANIYADVARENQHSVLNSEVQHSIHSTNIQCVCVCVPFQQLVSPLPNIFIQLKQISQTRNLKQKDAARRKNFGHQPKGNIGKLTPSAPFAKLSVLQMRISMILLISTVCC